MDIQVLAGGPFGLVPVRAWATVRFHLRHRLRIVHISAEGPGATVVYLTGRHLDEVPGTGYRWRFLTRDDWHRAYALPAFRAADRMTMRLALPSGAGGALRPGVRVLAEAVRPWNDGGVGDGTGTGSGEGR